LAVGLFARRANNDGASPSGLDTASPHDAAPQDEEAASNRVTLSSSAYESARILVARVTTDTTTAASGSISVPGQVEADPARVALISPRTSARIERLTVVEGDRVHRGR
jgi:multidrug efflux pump subunit AcrA (membrane-fusion protein)